MIESTSTNAVDDKDVYQPILEPLYGQGIVLVACVEALGFDHVSQISAGGAQRIWRKHTLDAFLQNFVDKAKPTD